MKKSKPALLIVGAGFFGLTIAERVANELGLPVHVIDRRSHIGGNAYSYFDEVTGIEVHKYGSHLFHTSNETVWNYVSQFSSFNDYRHTAVSFHDHQYYPIPINLQTISQVFGSALSPAEARRRIAEDISKSNHRSKSNEDNFESRALDTIGPTLYNALIRGYTLKQWQTDPQNLPASVFSRLPVRFDFKSGYFSDTWEGLPTDGYGKLFENMIQNPLISISLGVDYFSVGGDETENLPVVFTGPIDKFFGYRFGRLGWRTLDFEIEALPGVADYQGTSIVNYPDLEFDFTRIHEFKHLHPERQHDKTSTVIAREYSRWALDADEPYYPVNSPEDRRILNSYRSLASNREGVFFGGRLGTYQYLDMHMAMASALQMFRNELSPYLRSLRT